MNTAVVNVKVDPKIKKKAQSIADELGLSLSAVVNGYLRQFIQLKTISFGKAEEPSDYLIRELKKSEADIKAGRVISFDHPNKALNYLDKIIREEKNVSKN